MTQVDRLGAAVSVFFESGAFGTIVRVLFWLVMHALRTETPGAPHTTQRPP